ncbi:uncharacterized protein LOC126367039 [Pectinophora gossypiella]|uniref:uncharacterized protein LOC126367039 n=1 Tax=Pectinophora gossypiella TaxID=13191 RepID=UPI00214EA39E|nr:uncharacterized protein LOC126367039 [Pectinophora gossypiella]
MFSFLVVIFLVITNGEVRTSVPEVFTIRTEGCSIPAFPLISDTVRDLLAPPATMTPNCTETVPLVAANDTHIWVKKETYDMFDIFQDSELNCCYRNFSAEGNVENVAYGICRDFTSCIKAEHEFVRVECYYSGNKIYEDLFRFNFFGMKQLRKRNERSFNVLMLGVDSMSRKNFLRTMSKTSSFLKYRGSIQLYGYNKLGDNSFPNLFPMLTGKNFNEAKKVCWKNNVMDPTACTFMWDAFKSAGYYTALAADSAIGVLGVYETYLRYKPTDFYWQTFMFETRHLFRDRTFDYHICLRNRYIFKELLKYANDVIKTVHQGKLFGFFWEESVSHSHVNYPYIMDNDYLNLLQELERSKYLEDTIVILFSDHGTRWGQILETEQGRQESRLPLFEILFPMKFRRRYRTAFKNFEINSRRLTTAHDVYETLLDLINTSSLDERHIQERMKTVNVEATGISLFLPIPTNRTCETVGVNDHWCTCIKGQKVAVGTKGQIFTAQYLLQHINQIISEYPQCHKLGIDKILEVAATKNKDGIGRTYRVLLQATPGDAVFEGTLIRDRGLWTVVGSVSRLNLYRDQSRCVKDPLVKMYCYCRR